MHPKQNNMPEDAIKSGEPLRKAAVKKSNPEEPKKFRKYPKSVIDSTPQIRVYDRYAEGSPGSSSASDNEGSVKYLIDVQIIADFFPGPNPHNMSVARESYIRSAIFETHSLNSAVVCQYDLGGSRRSKSLSQQSYIFSPLGSTTDTSTSYENTSLGSSITKFRDDFDNFKCKMKIFGESLNLCRCIASDFKGKLTVMDKRLGTLEKRQKVSRGESNYSAIIQQNKMLSNKTKDIAKKLQMCGTEEEMREVAGRLCRNYLHGAWKTVEPAELEFRRISGGLSNFLYYIALPEDKLVATANFIGSSPDINNDESKRFSGIMLDEPKKVLLRIYGQVHGERAMDAIVTESVIFTLLSERRLGPKLHGVFSGGRIEEFIPARPLLTKELTEPALSMKIAEKMAAIHSMDIPLSKEPNWLWKTMGKWLKTVKEDRLANGVASKGKTEEEMVIIKRLKTVDFDAEIEWLKKFLATVDSAVMFCHNDLQEGNILMLEDVTHNPNDDYVTTYVQTFDTDSNNSNKENNHTIQDSQQSIQNQTSNMSARSQTSLDMEGAPPFIQTKSSRATFMEHTQYDDANTSDTVISHISDSGEPRLVLIDFEYCAYNYRGFDLANHFQEWVYDYTNPSHPFYFENQDACPTLEQKEIFIKEYLKHYHANQSDEKEVQEPSIDAVNHLLSEVDAFALASHLFWSLWSIVNASKSQIPFGYWEYGLSRLETYLRLKQEVIKKDKFGFPQKRKICEVDI